MTGLLDKAAEEVRAKAAYIYSDSGYIPLEWDPKTRRKGNIDVDVKAQDGRTVIERYRYRGIQMNRDGSPMRLDLSKPEDVEFLKLVEEWVEKSGDPRVVKKNVRVIRGGNAEPEPFARYEKRSAQNIVELMAASMVDDDETNTDLLMRVARYELQREAGPRSEIIGFIDDYKGGVADEASDDLVVVDE